jgi:hypothetical protein
VRALALEGRGDEARGRHLAALLALNWALRHDLFDYRPSRDPGRWLLLLVDVAGARLGLAPEARLRMPLATFLRRLDAIDLGRVGDRTGETLGRVLDDPAGSRRVRTDGWLQRASVAEVLWSLGIPSTGPAGREKHPQGRQLRKALRARVDLAWDARLAALEEAGEVDVVTLLAAVPGSYETAARAVQATLTRVGEDLAQLPFAVFYALLTDARRGGRVWWPADCFVEGGSYDRSTFDAAVGHALDDARSRKRRYRRSSALAELGFSAFYPATFARLDRWLASGRVAEFCLAGVPDPGRSVDWFAWTRRHAAGIAGRHRELVAALQRRPRTAHGS